MYLCVLTLSAAVQAKPKTVLFMSDYGKTRITGFHVEAPRFSVKRFTGRYHHKTSGFFWRAAALNGTKRPSLPYLGDEVKYVRWSVFV
jgi:hypothetical protein